MSRANKAASPEFRARETMRRSRKSRTSTPSATRRCDGLVIRRMGLDEMIDRRTRGGLAAFVEPEPRGPFRNSKDHRTPGTKRARTLSP